VVVGSFDKDALVEPCPGADERDQVGCVDGAPAAFGGLEEPERHRDTCRCLRGEAIARRRDVIDAAIALLADDGDHIVTSDPEDIEP